MPRVLIVDDDFRQLELRARLLEAGGYQVELAFSTSEALRRLVPADAVVMDLRLPNAQGQADAAEGLKLIRQIREAGSHAPVIVLSGWPDDLDGTPEERLVARVMVKPVGMAALHDAIAQCLTGAAAPARNPA